MFSKAHVSNVLAEFLGTAILVMVALVLTETTAVSYFIGTSVAVALAVVYMVFGQISGGHFNPAVTIGMWTGRMISTVRGISYIAAQLLAGLAALELYQYFTNHTLPARHTHFSWPMWTAELVGTAILASTLTAVIVRKFDNLQAGFAYGAAYFVGIIVAATSSAAYLNPAVALGLRNFNAVYILGPLVGAIVGVNLYQYFFAPGAMRATSSVTKTTVTTRNAVPKKK